MTDYLNPRSMLTPGVAGGMIMGVANSVWTAFGVEPRWTALALSLAMSWLAIRASKVALGQAAVFLPLNALVIFSMALGSNGLGAVAARAVEGGEGVSWLPGAQPVMAAEEPHEKVNPIEPITRVELLSSVELDWTQHWLAILDTTSYPVVRQGLQRLLDHHAAAMDLLQVTPPAPQQENRPFFKGKW